MDEKQVEEEGEKKEAVWHLKWFDMEKPYFQHPLQKFPQGVESRKEIVTRESVELNQKALPLPGVVSEEVAVYSSSASGWLLSLCINFTVIIITFSLAK